MKRQSPVMVATLLTGLIASSCDQSQSAPTTAAGSAVPTVARNELADLCKKMCDKDVECAGETAKQAAKAAGLEDVATEAAKKAMKTAAAGLSECKQGCVATAEKGATGGKAQAEEIGKCLAASECTAYGKCIEQASLATTKPKK